MASQDTITVHNPLDAEQVLEFREHHGRSERIVVPARGSAKVPARYRSAIWHRRCEDEQCRNSGLPWCQRGHTSGIVVGGLAPQLIEGEVKP